MGFTLCYFSHMCVVLLYVLILHCAVAKFDSSQVIQDETGDEMSGIAGGVTLIPHKDIMKYPDFVKGLRIAEAEGLNQDLVFDRKSLVVSKQVVQGVLYRVKVDVLQSCSASKNCNLKKHCSFQIWSRVWLPEDQRLIVSTLNCTHS